MNKQKSNVTNINKYLALEDKSPTDSEILYEIKILISKFKNPGVKTPIKRGWQQANAINAQSQLIK